jgi:uncharacterized cupredoxin-like copper-binding protein
VIATRHAILASALIVGGACGGVSSSAAADEGRTIHVEMSDDAFSPPQIVLAAGETITLVFTNVGSLEHEFMAGMGGMPGQGYMQDWAGMANARGSVSHDLDHAGTGIRVAPHGTAKLTLTVPSQSGQFEFGCFIPGHYEGGMRGVLVVASSAPTANPGVLPMAPTDPLPQATMAPMGDPMDMEGH